MKRRKRTERGGPTSKAAKKTPVRRDGGESWSSLTYQGSVQAKFARRYQRPCVDSYSKSIINASSGLMHLVRAMHRDVTHMERVEVSDEFFDKTFIRQLMLGTGGMRRENELVHALHEIFAEFPFEGNRYSGDGNIYIYGAMK